MKRINTKQNAFLHYLIPLLLIIFLILPKAECFSTQAAGRCNGTRISDCLADDEEVLMDSESNRRVLKGNTLNVGKLPLNRVKFCNRDAYGSCIGKDSKFYKKGPCAYLNQCR